MADIPTQVVAQLQLIDLDTGQGRKDFLQLLNQIIRILRDHETRIDALEP